jgi:TRAP transporter TAXI family solute receptor
MLREQRALYAATSVAGSFFAQEGLFAYAAIEWGPQPVRLVLVNMHSQLLGIVAAGDSGIGSIADLKGKRLARVGDAPELEHHLSALLAFAGLGWSDITVVPVARYGAAIEAIIANRADAAFAASTTPELQRLAKSRRGLEWPVVAAADQEGWKAIRSIAPYLLAVDATEGTGLSDKAPVESVNWPYPVLTTHAKSAADDVHRLASTLINRYRQFRDQAPGNSGWEAKRQPLSWAMPWHDGAIRALSEQGLWSAAHQAHNERLIRRQQVLLEAWESFRRDAPGKAGDEQAGEAAWLKARAAALKAAGFEPLTAIGLAPTGNTAN